MDSVLYTGQVQKQYCNILLATEALEEVVGKFDELFTVVTDLWRGGVRGRGVFVACL